MNLHLAVLEGDGIGPEIIREGLKVLDAVAGQFGHTFVYHRAPFGAGAYFSCGSPFPDETKHICDEADVILKGPVGLSVEKMSSIPLDCRPEKGAILPLRKRYDTFANFRPVYLPKELACFSPLKEEVIGDGIDILMIRELVGGIYFGDKTEARDTDNEYAADRCVYNRHEVERIARVAFTEAARQHTRLTNVHKANVLASSRFWNMVVEGVQKDFPQVEYHSVLVDNAAFQLVKNPTQFNGVMLLENMQGDILTDQAGGILGSLGLMPSACIGPEKSYVEPAHGSAPDIAGKNIANPYSMIGSVALMLDRCFGLAEEGGMIFDAMARLFRDGFRTVDLADKQTDASKILSTGDFGDRVAGLIRGSLRCRMSLP
jgi:3-isopropylmalate dehydrogenase